MKFHELWLLLVFGAVVCVCCRSTANVPSSNEVFVTAESTAMILADSPTVPPTETAVFPTRTQLPATAPPTATLLPTVTATPEPVKITSPAELVGYWEYNGIHTNGGGELHYIYRFQADGILEVADSINAFDSGEIKARTDFWFEDGVWHTQIVNGFWQNKTCFTGSGKPLTGRYEIRPDDEGILRFFRISDQCQVRNFSLSDNDGTLTPIIMDTIDWFTDVETGLPLNPTEFPADGRFVLVGTMLRLDIVGDENTLVTVRLPSGRIVDASTPALPDIQVQNDETIDLTDYDPEFPFRVRLIVEQQIDGKLLGEQMTILNAW